MLIRGLIYIIETYITLQICEHYISKLLLSKLVYGWLRWIGKLLMFLAALSNHLSQLVCIYHVYAVISLVNKNNWYKTETIFNIIYSSKMILKCWVKPTIYFLLFWQSNLFKQHCHWVSSFQFFLIANEKIPHSGDTNSLDGWG